MLANIEQDRTVTTPQVTGQTESTTPQAAQGQEVKAPSAWQPWTGAWSGTKQTTGSGTGWGGWSLPNVKANTGGGSNTYNNTMAALEQAKTQGGSFTSEYDDEIARLYDEIANRESFSYDYSTDPLYNQYREQYTTLGNQAMRDTVGQAAALTGGYGNSYAESAGQQQYDAYLSRLNEIMPELYSNAYNVYQNEGSRLSQLYSMAGDQRDTAYQRYRDALADAQYEDALSIQQAMDRASLGDWAAYADIYGMDAARKAAIISNPQAAWASGLASADDVYRYTGAYPLGYEDPNKKTSSSGGGGGGAEWGPAQQAIVDELHAQGEKWVPGVHYNIV